MLFHNSSGEFTACLSKRTFNPRPKELRQLCCQCQRRATQDAKSITKICKITLLLHPQIWGWQVSGNMQSFNHHSHRLDFKALGYCRRGTNSKVSERTMHERACLCCQNWVHLKCSKDRWRVFLEPSENRRLHWRSTRWEWFWRRLWWRKTIPRRLMICQLASV